MALCPHSYWHPSQCPYCQLSALRFQLILAKAAARAAQRDFDLVAGENARLRYQLGAAQARQRARARERQRRLQRKRAAAS